MEESRDMGIIEENTLWGSFRLKSIFGNPWGNNIIRLIKIEIRGVCIEQKWSKFKDYSHCYIYAAFYAIWLP